MTPVEAALIHLMDRYLRDLREPWISPHEANYLLHFLHAAGVPPLLQGDEAHLARLFQSFQSQRVQDTAGSRLTIDLDDLSPALASVAECLALLPETQTQVDRVARLIDGFSSPFGLDLLVTVHKRAPVNPEDAGADLKSMRRGKDHVFSTRQVVMTMKRLREQGWLTPPPSCNKMSPSS